MATFVRTRPRGSRSGPCRDYGSIRLLSWWVKRRWNGSRLGYGFRRAWKRREWEEFTSCIWTRWRAKGPTRALRSRIQREDETSKWGLWETKGFRVAITIRIIGAHRERKTNDAELARTYRLAIVKWSARIITTPKRTPYSVAWAWAGPVNHGSERRGALKVTWRA